MELIPEVDEAKTIKNAKHFLTYQLPKMMSQAHVQTIDIKSPTISDMPTGSVIGNSNETKVVNMMQRKQDVKDVVSTIKALKDKEAFILNAVYLKGEEGIKVANEIGYSVSRYQDLKNRALISFACAMDVYGVELMANKNRNSINKTLTE